MVQLRLYKHYYSKQQNIPLNRIKTMFYVMPRTESSTHKQLIDVISGEKTIAKDLENLNLFFERVYKIRQYYPILTQNECRFCDYKGTSDCKESRRI